MDHDQQPEAAHEEDAELPLGTEEHAAQVLAPFLERHPQSKIVRHKIGDADVLAIENPWSDATLITLLFDEADDLASVLNQVLLPERLSAIWHIDTKDLEVVWTAFELGENQKEIADRKFEFRYGRKKYKCEFGNSSERLLKLAEKTIPRSNPTSTNFRNLSSFNSFVTSDDEDKLKEFLDKPRSFWIRKASMEEDDLVEMIGLLNFYMTYFDAQSPTILVHQVEQTGIVPRTRYHRGKFPEIISARALDENLISFWGAADRGNEMLRFILYYRVIEYAAFHYIDVKIRQRLRKLILDPMCGQEPERTISSILEALDPGKVDEVPRFNDLLASAVDATLVWREIEANRESFSKSVTFDGGFKLDAIVGKNETEETFGAGGMVKFGDAIRKIRNVLAHGRDQRTAKVITPTLRNMALLKPWVNAIAAAAGEVVLYEATA